MAKYMYKPMGNGKYAEILYVDAIYESNKKKGWLLELPDRFKEKTVEVKTTDNVKPVEVEEKIEEKTASIEKPYVRGQRFEQKGNRRKS